MMDQTIQCWCGNTALVAFSPEYWRCPACETLVSARRPGAEIAQVGDDEHGFYGRRYWFEHQEQDLSSINIVTRARRDLRERCVYWLRALLNYRVPPGRALEVGCGHGGFVAMLNWAGFDAAGIELSPWVVEFARQTFDIPIEVGSVEGLSRPGAALDLVVLMDVLEHLPDPVAAMQRCVDLLGPDGILYIQTPCYPAGCSYAELAERNDIFLKMLLPDEHVYLFSQAALRRLCEQIGAGAIEFVPPMAGHDQLAFASRQPLVRVPGAEIDRVLSRPSMPLLLRALLDQEDAIAELVASLKTHIQAKERAYAELQAWVAARVEASDQHAAALAARMHESQASAEAYVASLRDTLAAREREIANATSYIASLRDTLAAREAELARLKQSKWPLNRKQ
jgi:2-polyprenyl-3-methyl-5-hydroxy-6-metoxy-1,4-benzoquinol methylase